MVFFSDNNAEMQAETDAKLKALSQGAPKQERIASAIVSASSQQRTGDKLKFKSAPDHNDMFDAAKLFANSMNKSIEKEWVKIRLETRIAREHKQKMAAELATKEAELKKEQVTAQIVALTRNSGSAIAGNSTVDYEKISELPKVSLQSYTVVKGGGSSVDLKINDVVFENVKAGHYVDKFLVTKLIDKDRCVRLIYQSVANQTVCG